MKYAAEQNAAARSAGQIFTNEEQAYIDMLDRNLLYGIDGLTTQQALGGANNILSKINSGMYTGYLASNDATMINSYLSQFSNLGTYASIAHGVEAANIVGESGSQLTVGDIIGLEEGDVGYVEATKALDEMGYTMDEVRDIAEALNDEIAQASNAYGDLTGEVLSNSKAWKGTARDIASARKQLNATIQTATNNQWARNEFIGGSTDSEVIDTIASMVGLSADDVKERRDDIIKQLTDFEAADLESVQIEASGLDDQLTDSLNEYLSSSGNLEIDLPGITGNANGQVDFSDAAATLNGMVDAELLDIVNQMAGKGIQGYIQLTETENGFDAELIVTGLGTGRKSGGGGGGGGGKSAVDKLLEEQEREQKLWEHRRKMIQYEETRYQNAGELTNYAIMLGHESDEIQRQIGLREKQLEQLKKQMSSTKAYSDDWYTLRDAILACEEALAE